LLFAVAGDGAARLRMDARHDPPELIPPGVANRARGFPAARLRSLSIR